MKATSFKTTDDRVRKVVTAAIDSGQWELEIGSKHQRIRHTSGRMVTFGKTSSDRDSHLFLARDIRRVEAGMPGWGQSKEIPQEVTIKKRKHSVHINRH